jgi:polyphenol oxidase
VKPVAQPIEQIASKKQEWMPEDIDGLTVYCSPLLSQFPGLTHAFTTRVGGKTAKPMNSFNLGLHLFEEPWISDARENRTKLCAALSLESERLVVPNQPHSTDVLFTREPITKKADLEADGIITDATLLPLLLFFADCVPILIYDPTKKVVSIVHAGWRGTAGSIVRQAVKSMNEHCGCKPCDLVAAIGPAIGACCYPVKNEVVLQLMASFGLTLPAQATSNQILDKIRQSNLDQLFLLQNQQICPDLKALNALQLLQAGVAQVDVTEFCTACNPEMFYSYRHAQGNTGRQGLIAALTDGMMPR